MKKYKLFNVNQVKSTNNEIKKYFYNIFKTK
jgi:hypothetical protein